MTDIICLIDEEIECLKQEDALRNWNRFFTGFSSKFISKYKNKGKYRLMALVQHTDKKLWQILKTLRADYSFIDSDFNDVTGELIVKNIKTGEFESIYIGDNIADMVLEICKEFEDKEMKPILAEQEKQLAREVKIKKRINKMVAVEARA